MDLAFRRGFLRAPPPETMFLHRKLVGSFLLCARIHARVDVHHQRVVVQHARGEQCVLLVLHAEEQVAQATGPRRAR